MAVPTGLHFLMDATESFWYTEITHVHVSAQCSGHGSRQTLWPRTHNALVNKDRSWVIQKRRWNARKRQGGKKRLRNEMFGHSGRDGWNNVSRCVLGQAPAVCLPAHRTDNRTCREGSRHRTGLELSPGGPVKTVSSCNLSSVPL